VVTILACGDIGVKRADATSMFAAVAPGLRAADLVIGQLECAISERGARVPNAKLAMRAPPAMARAVRDAGVSLMSFAGNHCLDYGYDAFEDTFRHAHEAGIGLCGAGPQLAAARQALVRTVAGLRVAVLAASAILPEGYAAEADKPGCAPLRAHTLYEQVEHDQPGTPARIRSFAHRADRDALCEAVRAARGGADVVLVSLHWGIHMVPVTIAEYQIEVAHALIDAGADAILGHHPHVLKGIEIYRDRPIYYSLGNFAIEQPQVWDPAITRSASFRDLVSLNPTWRPHERYTLPEVTRLTGLAKLLVTADGRPEARFTPAWIGDDSAPRLLDPADPRFARIGQFLAESSAEAGFATQLRTIDGDFQLQGPG